MHRRPALSPRRSAAALLLSMVACACHGFDLQGHRGARALAPENTLAAFDRALAEGVSTLELDVAVSADGAVVISHDLRLNPALTRDTRDGSGRWLSGPGPAIHTLRLAELAHYDVGRLDPASRYAADFPRQQANDGQRLPTLAGLLRHLRGLDTPQSRTVRLNVEAKSDPRQPELTLAPEPLAARVIGELRDGGMLERATLQSFDWRVLQAARRQAPALPLACLSTPRTLEDPAWTAGRRRDAFVSAAAMVADAGCRIWSPAHATLGAAEVDAAHRLGLAVLPWTVNRRADIERLLALGVDGLITDEPDTAAALLRERGIVVAPLR